MSTSIHVSVAWPYANGDLHLGHVAGALLPADIFARYHRLKGHRVLMVSGSDTHGTPITIEADRTGDRASSTLPGTTSVAGCKGVPSLVISTGASQCR